MQHSSDVMLAKWSFSPPTPGPGIASVKVSGVCRADVLAPDGYLVLVWRGERKRWEVLVFLWLRKRRLRGTSA